MGRALVVPISLLIVVGCSPDGPRLDVLGEASAAPEHVVGAVLDSLEAERAGSSDETAATLLLVPPGQLGEVPDNFRCTHAVVDPRAGDPLALTTLVAHDSLLSMDGGVVGLASVRSVAAMSLAASAAEHGMGVVPIAQAESMPPDHSIGVVVSGTPQTAAHWFVADRVDAVRAGLVDAGYQLALPRVATHVLCASDPASLAQAVRRARDEQLVELSEEMADALTHREPVPEGGATRPVVVFGRAGDGSGDFGEPDAIAIDREGRVLVGDERRRLVHLYDAEGRWLTSFGGPGDEPGRFKGPVGGIAVSSQGEVYVADLGRAAIQVFDGQGRFVRMFGGLGHGDGTFFTPSGIAIGPDDTVYVSDDGRSNVQVFSAEGEHLRTFGEVGSAPGQFMALESLAVGPDGSLYVADEGNRRIQRFDAEGRFRAEIGKHGAGAVAADVEGQALDDRGRLWALDEDAGLVRGFDDEGRPIGTLGAGPGTGPGQMLSPDGLAFHPQSRLLYVVDELNYRIQAFRVDDFAPPTDEAEADGAVATRAFVLGRVGDPRKQVARWEPLAREVAARLAPRGEVWEGRVRALRTLEDAARAFATREIDWFVDSSVATLQVTASEAAEPLLAASRDGTLTYRSVVFTRRGSEIEDLEGLRGHRIAFEDRASSSAFALPMVLLRNRDLRIVELSSVEQEPRRDEVGYVFAGAERTMSSWVHAGMVSAAAFSDLDFAELGALREEFAIVEASPRVLYYLAAARTDLGERVQERLRETLLALHATKEGRDALGQARMDRFVRLDEPEVREPLERARALTAALSQPGSDRREPSR